MSEGSSHRREYMLIFAVLAILTLIEVAAAEMFTGGAKLWSLIILALVKAGCVAVYYMHLKAETNWLRFIAVSPAIMGLYVYVLAFEVMYR